MHNKLIVHAIEFAFSISYFIFVLYLSTVLVAPTQTQGNRLLPVAGKHNPSSHHLINAI